MKTAIMACVAAVLALLLPAGAATGTDAAGDFEKMVETAGAKVQELRGLKFKSSVAVGMKSRKELADFLRRSLDEEFPEKKAADVERAYKKFGLIPADLNLRKTVLDMLESQIGGFYDPQTKKLYVIKPGEGAGAAAGMMKQVDAFLKMAGTSLDEITAAHELVHALQDQHYDLMKLQAPISGNDDRTNAFKCLVEGDAVEVQNEFLFAKIPPQFKGLLKALSKSGGDSGMNVPQPGLEGVPEFLKVSLIYPYAAGAKLIEKIKEKGGRESIEAFFKNPPLSTEQVMHIEKLLDNPDEPTQVEFKDLAKALPEGARLLEQNVLGELGVFILLKQFMGEDEARPAAAGWDGDSFAAFDVAGGTALVWVSNWDGEDHAEEFAAAYRNLLDSKYDGRGRFEAGTTDESGLEFAGLEGGGGYNVIVRRGADVAVIEGLPRAAAHRLAGAIWSRFSKSPYKHHTLLPMPGIPDRKPQPGTPRMDAGEFRIPEPAEGWNKYAGRGGMARFSLLNAKLDACIEGSVLDLGAEMTPEKVAGLMARGLEGRIEGLAIAGSEPVEGAGMQGRQITYSGRDPDTGAAMVWRQAVFCRGKSAYVFTLSVPKENFEKALEYFGAFLEGTLIKEK